MRTSILCIDPDRRRHPRWYSERSLRARMTSSNEPPAGFTALFNGQDLSGWYGMASVSPVRVAAMTDEDRAKKKAADTEDALQALARRER